MPFITPLAIGAFTAVPKVAAAIKQDEAARKLKLQDTTPAAFREKAALDRQAAASGVMPGQVGAQTRLAGIQAGALNAARMGAGSSSDFLAAAGAADARRQAGEQQLGTQAAQYGIRAQQQVGADLTQQAAYQKNDLDTYNKTKAALVQGSAENLNNAVEGAASYAAYGLNNTANAQASLGLNGRAADRALGADALTPLAPRVRAAGSAELPDALPYSGGYTAPFGVQGLNRNRYKMPRVGAY